MTATLWLTLARSPRTLRAMSLRFALAFVLAVGCGAAEPDPTPTSRSPSPASCTTDAECTTCTIDECGCGGAAAGACPPTVFDCYADPCTDFVAACRAGQCVVERAAAVPATPPASRCTSDADCRACAAPACTCIAVAAAECPPPQAPCAAYPCTGATAACRDGACVLTRDESP